MQTRQAWVIFKRVRLTIENGHIKKKKKLYINMILEWPVKPVILNGSLCFDWYVAKPDYRTTDTITKQVITITDRQMFYQLWYKCQSCY